MTSKSPNAKTCPNCKSGISADKLIPIYVQGNDKDPRTDIPKRPAGQRSQSDTGDNVRWNASIGVFPFGFAFVLFLC
jgi:E3 ubiquitin-protein ligase RNF5